MLSADQVIGLESTIASLSTTHYEASTIDELSGNYNNGDTAVVKELIADGKYSYTAYVYDGSLSSWKAMDGNYDARNVYFNDDMTMTYQFGKYAVPSSGSFTLSCKGMSLATMINDAYAEAKDPTVTQPAITLTTTATLTGEVGATYTVPKATLKFTRGTYEYASP